MDAFLKKRTKHQIKQFISSSLQDYKKVIDQMYKQIPTLIDGYTPLQRLAYILHIQDYKVIHNLKTLLKQISIGSLSINSKIFHMFLLKNSQFTPQVKYDEEEYSDSDSCVEELILMD